MQFLWQNLTCGECCCRNVVLRIFLVSGWPNALKDWLHNIYTTVFYDSVEFNYVYFTRQKYSSAILQNCHSLISETIWVDGFIIAQLYQHCMLNVGLNLILTSDQRSSKNVPFFYCHVIVICGHIEYRLLD